MIFFLVFVIVLMFVEFGMDEIVFVVGNYCWIFLRLIVICFCLGCDVL